MSLFNNPKFTEKEAEQFAAKHYGLKTNAKLLTSERDQNFVLNINNKKYILKIANASENPELLKAQNAALEHVSKHLEGAAVLLHALNGETLVSVQGEQQHFLRILSYVEGKPLAKQTYQSLDLFEHLGEQVAKLNKVLRQFDNAALHRDFYWDLAKAPLELRRYQHLMKDSSKAAQVDILYSYFEDYAEPYLGHLEKSIIHNDANDYNIMVGGGTDPYNKNQFITGIIDFGDMVYSHTINDLAIAMAYALLDKEDPLAVALALVKGYNRIAPLSETELKVLYPLACLRLCASVAIAAHQQSLKPDDAYLGVSQEPIRKTLPKLVNLKPAFVEASFRQICNLEPLEKARAVTTYLKDCAVQAILPQALFEANPVLIDLSIASPDLPYDTRIDQESIDPDRVFRLMKERDSQLGLGRYNEPRLIYTAPEFADNSHPLSARRTVHLGLDLFAEVDTAIYAPLDGTVHAVSKNPLPLDYGHILILEHQTSNAEAFYTMYGHLRKDVLKLKKGQSIKAGDRIAHIGDWSENGGWAPHLHFQLMTDLLGLATDFPAVFKATEVDVWQAFCLNPNLITRLDNGLTTYQVRSKEDSLQERQKRIGKSLSIGYKKPLKMLRGRAQYLFDETGQTYLDAYNNVPHVGHAHPKVVDAAVKQMRILNTNTRYLSDSILDYAEQLSATLPESLNTCFFVSSGSEANELALRLARTHTGSKQLIVQEGAYHGHTNTLIDISPYKHDGPGGQGAPDWVHTVPIADTYRGKYKASDKDAGRKYADSIKDTLERLNKPASFIAESCPSVGGQIIFPEGYLQAAHKHLKKVGGLYIADEVQTAYGRTGKSFYAFEAQNVIPDIVVLGKPIGNGHPLGAVITTQAIADRFNNGMEFFATFGGNNVSCEIGKTVLSIVQEERLQQHALEIGNYLIENLRPLQERFELIGDIRGSGLFLGIELVKSRDTLEPAAQEASFISNRMREQNILLGTDGPLHNVLKIRPPMPFDKANADVLLASFESILAMHF